MTYESLQKANSTIKTTDIKGKAYAEVNERIRVFRMLYPEGTISTEIISIENGVCVVKATVRNSDGAVLGTGHAYEKEGSTFINKTSYIENAETSAVGRALGMVGIGIDTSVASYEEVANAIEQQKDGKKEPEKKETKTEEKKVLTEEDKIARQMFLELCKTYSLNAVEVCKKYNLTNSSDAQDFYDAMDTIKGGDKT